MIKTLRIQNYKALRDVTLKLTPIHVLIGPNDSGKTSILEAVAALCRSVDHRLAEAFAGAWEGRQLVWQGNRDVPISLTAIVSHESEEFEYHLSCSFAPKGRSVTVDSEWIRLGVQGSPADLKSRGFDESKVFQAEVRGKKSSDNQRLLTQFAYKALQGVQSYRWDARFLALPIAPDAKRRFRMEPSGFGLALLLDDILGFDRELFITLEDEFREIFPAIKSIKLIAETAYRSPVDNPEQIPMLQKSDGKGLYFEFEGEGDPVPARQVSDGVLLVLAYLAVLHLPEPPRVLLVEEPENGIHPKRLQDVLQILRKLVDKQSRTQVILTTHSPYVVDLFESNEVTLCRKEPDGAVSVRRLSESKTVQEQLDVFTLGEIWTAEGDEALVHPLVPEGEH